MMRRMMTAAVLIGLSAPAALADATFFLGGQYSFGGADNDGQFGVTAKVLSDDEPDRGIVALGATWYPGAPQPFGADLSLGYLFENGALTFGYDVLQNAPVVGLGYANTDDGDDNGDEDEVIDVETPG